MERPVRTRVEVKNVPPGINDFKLKTQLKQSVGNDSININAKKDDDGKKVFEIMFPNLQDATAFVEKGVRVTFGGKTHLLMCCVLQDGRAQEEQARSMEPDIVVSDANAPYTWSSLVEQYGRMPIAPGTKCVVLAKSTEARDKHVLKLYFENKKRSGGDKIKNMIRMVDGMLIQYEDDAVAEKVAEKKQSLSDKSMPTHLRTVPGLSTNKVILENVPEGTMQDTVMLFLENCDKPRERGPQHIIKGHKDGQYMVVYSESMDLQKLTGNIEQEKLNEQYIKTKLVTSTNCIQIRGNIKSLSNDAIRLNMESFKRSKGGEVTLVQRCGDKVALIHFAECYVAERVVQTWSEKDFVINKIPTKVGFYYHCLFNDHLNLKPDVFSPNKETKPTPTPTPALSVPAKLNPQNMEQNKSITFIPKLPEAMDFIKNSQPHYSSFENMFDKFADVKCQFNKQQKLTGIVVTPKPNQMIPANEFEKECRRKLENFFDSFAMEDMIFDAQKLSQLRERNNWRSDEEFIELPSEEGTVSVFIRWKSGRLQMIGVANDVKRAQQILHSLTKVKSQTQKFKQRDFRKLMETGCLEKIASEQKGKVKVKAIKAAHTLEYIGPIEHLQPAITDTLMQLQSLEEKKVKDIRDMERKYLEAELNRELLESESGMNIRAIIQAKFEEKGVGASLHLKDDDIVLYYHKEECYKDAVAIVKKLITSTQISVDRPTQINALSTTEWKNQQQQLCAMGSRRIFLDKQAKVVTISGLTANVNEGKLKFLDFLENNELRTVTIEASHLAQRYFIEFDKDTQHKILGMDTKFQKSEATDICLEGKKSGVTEAKKMISKQLEKYVELKWNIHDPGMPEHFRSQQGKRFLRDTERKTSCVIETNPEPVKHEKENDNTDKEAASPIKPMISVQVPNCRATINVLKTDITKHKCDAIMNASNPQLDLLPGGISGAIQKIGGEKIQQEMHAVIGNQGKLFPGDAAITGAGKLKSCNFIIHAVGPRWSDHSHSMCCSYLQSCINYSMEEAEKQQLNSIAIPAISCGVFGGDPSVCIPLIVNTVLDYFTQNRNSSINQVDFVEMTSDSILKDFVNALGALKVVEDEQSAILKVSPVKNQVVVVQKEAISQSDTLTLGSISISVSQGDLTRDNSDAIVNSTNPHFDLTQGMVSKAILKNGGQSILHECRNQQGHWNTPTLRVTSGGNLPCRYVFHIVTPNDIKQIATVLLEVFKTADMLGLATLAIPALGTGNLRIGGTKVAQCIRGAIKEYVDSNTPANLNTIKVVIFQQSMVAEFRKGLFADVKQRGGLKGLLGNMWSAFTGVEPEEQMAELDPKKQISFFFCSDKRSNVEEAKREIIAHVKDNSASQPLEDEAIARLEDEDKKEIMALEHKFNVEIKDVSNAYIKRYVIKGMEKNVLNAKHAGLEIIRAFKEGETCSRYVSWEYVDPSTKTIIKFSNRNNAALEKAYGLDKTGKKTVMTRDGQQIQVDFSNYTAEYVQSKAGTEVTRREKNDDVPSNWEPMKDEGMIKVLIKPGTVEYNRVMSKFNASGPFLFAHRQQLPPRVVSLERIQHKSQYKQFVAKKNEVESRMKKDNVQMEVVKELFHGTQFDVSEKIYVQGFDRNFAGANATVYGKGVYFALNATYSSRYAAPNPNMGNQCKMFLADVVTGEYCLGNQNLIAPPPRQTASNKSQLYDSVVDNMASPTIYVVFKDASAYPKYLLTYTS
nr:poly [ADP-ribose] polymerase 14 [Ciona intestinalis]|eukprot:XP_018668926.1 poly [ADP-ribose] polymerase 14 [Ciona intestinalis]